MATRVLLVEDDSDDRDLFSRFFAERDDILLMPAVSNGLELVDYLMNTKSDNDLPDLIVLDQNMPLMNGKQTLAFLKSHARFTRIPAVIYSTYTDSNLVIECKKLGASMVAVKPIDHEGYQKMMNDFLQVI
jgi:CheY-like chemotaxis protein